MFNTGLLRYSPPKAYVELFVVVVVFLPPTVKEMVRNMRKSMLTVVASRFYHGNT